MGRAVAIFESNLSSVNRSQAAGEEPAVTASLGGSHWTPGVSSVRHEQSALSEGDLEGSHWTPGASSARHDQSAVSEGDLEGSPWTPGACSAHHDRSATSEGDRDDRLNKAHVDLAAAGKGEQRGNVCGYTTANKTEGNEGNEGGYIEGFTTVHESEEGYTQGYTQGYTTGKQSADDELAAAHAREKAVAGGLQEFRDRQAALTTELRRAVAMEESLELATGRMETLELEVEP